MGVADPAECDWSIISHETPTTDMVRPRGEWVGITVEYEAPRPSEPPPAPAPPTDEDLVDSWLNFEDLEEEGLDAIEETDESVNTFLVAGDSVSGRRCQRRLRNFLGFDSITVDKAVRLYWQTRENPVSGFVAFEVLCVRGHHWGMERRQKESLKSWLTLIRCLQ